MGGLQANRIKLVGKFFLEAETKIQKTVLVFAGRIDVLA
jgi:hypothetical protein